jgi:hypothetical protein
MTNVEAVRDLMEFSNYGALAQLFVIDALSKWSGKVANTPIEELRKQFGDLPFISPDAWQSVAKEIKSKLDAHLIGNSANKL